MRSSSSSALLAVAALAIFNSRPVAGQTYSNCNPLTSGSCPADSALGRSVNIDFTQGASDSFTAQGNPTYGSNGVQFTIAKSGDSPQLTSKWYIMFGKVEVTMEPAPGAGIVSSSVLQSDDLDEIDWEWLGADDSEAQSNYFGKGQTTTYNRGAFHADPSNQENFNTYTIDWTAEQIVWSINGNTVRALTPANADNQYPQTPMQLKIGAWSGGDSSNAAGTISWARGPTDYSKGPFTMTVKSVAVTDYSTGTQYTYSGTSGTWQEIHAVGGSVNSGGSASVSVASAPAVTSTSNSAPMPFEGTHRDTTSTYTTPSVFPWVAGATTLSTSTTPIATSNYPGLPSGWTVSGSGKVLPPSSAPSTSLVAPSTSSPSPSQSASSIQPGGPEEGTETVTEYNQKGFPTTVVEPAGFSTVPKSYNQQGFLITAGASTTTAPAASAAKLSKDDLTKDGSDTPDAAQSSSAMYSSGGFKVLETSATGAAPERHAGLASTLGAACAILGGALVL
ncbi:MAG: hypothetical protein M1819_002432 [Sarea resinae]|nr:MAG: hypothetical protein M1819_002432 [Sarea resinae]